MKYVIERSPVSESVDELVFLAADGFKFTAYVDAEDEYAAKEARTAFLMAITVKHPGEPMERLA